MYKAMKRNITKILATFLAVCLAAALCCIVGCGEDPPPPEKTVKSVSVVSEPTKTEYYVGEEFDLTGGKIKVAYSDDSTEELAMNAEGVSISDVNISISGDDDSEEKTVTVRFGGKSARFKITVSHKIFKFTFDYGYVGGGKVEQDIRKDDKMKEPTAPEREGYEFDDWYADPDFTEVYDFAQTAVTENTTVYALWKEKAAVYFNVGFNLNYAGSTAPTKQQVKEGEYARRPADPERYGYEFVGWYTDAKCENAYAFDLAPVVAQKILYAKWNRTLSEGVREYVFEAEDTDFTGKKGPGLSGTTTATAMIQTDNGELGASNGHFVGYQYANGCLIGFSFVSDVEVSDAKIVIRFSAELRDFVMNSGNYMIMLNGKSLDYGNISFTDVPAASVGDAGKINALPFKDYVIAENVTLKKGTNSIGLQTCNNHPLEGTTIEADAPLVDCLKITTSAILVWSEAEGLPKKGNY